MKREKIYEGKAKIIWSGPEDHQRVLEFKDDVTAFNKKKFEVMAGKGRVNLAITARIFEHLRRVGIDSHFIEKLNDKEILVKACQIIPLEVVVRNRAAGSIVKRLGLEKGSELPRPILEFFFKEDALDDPMVNQDHIIVFGWATQRQLEAIREAAMKINDVLISLFKKADLSLIDFKIEFGIPMDDPSALPILADEITPDSCRLWNSNDESFDKDVFRHDKGDLLNAYRYVLKNLEGELK